MRPDLRDFTSARVSLGRAGSGLPTAELLQLQLAHARARQAVHNQLDVRSLAGELAPFCQTLIVHSAAPDRSTYLRRPDLGRKLHPDFQQLVSLQSGAFDVAFVIADGLSADAIHRHAAAMTEAILKRLDTGWSVAPVVLVEQGRVAVGDEIGLLLGASLVVLFIGERPGLSSVDSLGIYLTWNPHPGTTDAERNCISNVRAEGLTYQLAAHKLLFLMAEARRRKLSGIDLKEDARPLLPAASS